MIDWFIEVQTFLRSYYSAPHSPPSPLSPVSKLSLFLCLPVCRRSSLYLRELGGGGGGGGGERSIESYGPRKLGPLSQSNYIYRVPQCMYPCRNWVPQPLSRKRVCPPPPNQRVGGQTSLRVGGGGGWGSPNSDDWRKSLALCLLCGLSK